MNENKKQSAHAAPEAWPEPRLRALQVDELYRNAAASAVYSYFGALLTFGVLVETGDFGRGALWLLWATAVTFFRAAIILLYRRREPGSNPQSWSRLVLTANFLAGLQWGVLGTILYPDGPAYAQVFTLMVIISFVAGSVTAYSSVPWGHHALSLPSTIPTSIYVFFVHDGPHWFAGITAVFFCLAIVYYSQRFYRHLERGFRLQLERDDLLALTAALNEKLARENEELAHRAAVRGASVETARERADRLEALVERSPVPHLECDSGGRIVTCNAAAEHLLGRSRRDLEGRPFASLVALAGAAAWQAIEGANVAGDATVAPVPLELRGPQGSSLRCDASIVPLPAAQGLKPGFGVVLSPCPEPATSTTS